MNEFLRPSAIKGHVLHDYQVEAIQYARSRKFAGLFLEMGLGKTAVCLRALTPDMLPALVVGTKRVTEKVWGPERDEWRPELSLSVAAGTPAQRKRALESDAQVIAISRDNISDAVPYAGKFKTLILDELSGFKNHKSIRFKAARSIIKTGSLSHVWGLTGTPMPNGLLDLWAQIALLDPQLRLGRNITTYRSRYFTPAPGKRLPNGTITQWDPLPGTRDAIFKLLEDTCIAMQADDKLDLPATTYLNHEVPMTPQTRAIYKTMKKDLVVSLDVLGGEVHSASSAAMLTNRLSQIAAGFLYVDDADIRGQQYTVIHREKPNALQEIVDGASSPILVAYHYQAELDLLKSKLGSLLHTIDEPDIIERWNRREIPVLVAHPASAGHGLNLQYGGHTMVWVTRPWSLEEYQQMNGRLARQGQTHPVMIHHLHTTRTTDDSKELVLAGKASYQQALLDHLESPL